MKRTRVELKIAGKLVLVGSEKRVRSKFWIARDQKRTKSRKTDILEHVFFFIKILVTTSSCWKNGTKDIKKEVQRKEQYIMYTLETWWYDRMISRATRGRIVWWVYHFKSTGSRTCATLDDTYERLYNTTEACFHKISRLFAIVAETYGGLPTTKIWHYIMGRGKKRCRRLWREGQLSS